MIIIDHKSDEVIQSIGFHDVVGLGKKLRLSQKKIDATIKEHPELTRIDAILTQLKVQRDTQESQT